MVYIKESWQVVFINQRAEKEVSALPQDMRAHFARIVKMIQAYGLENIHEPYIKHLTGKLWEMRLKGKDGIARAIYLTANERKLVVLHSFIKKTQQTPRQAIDLAFQRAKEGGLI